MNYAIIYDDDDEAKNTVWEYEHYTSAYFAFKNMVNLIREMRTGNYRNCKSGRDMFFKWRMWEGKFKTLTLFDKEKGKILKYYNIKEPLYHETDNN